MIIIIVTIIKEMIIKTIKLILLIINSPFQPGNSSTGSTIDRLQNKCLLKVRGASSTNH